MRQEGGVVMMAALAFLAVLIVLFFLYLIYRFIAVMIAINTPYDQKTARQLRLIDSVDHKLQKQGTYQRMGIEGDPEGPAVQGGPSILPAVAAGAAVVITAVAVERHHQHKGANGY
jgi:hypothetical protein